MPSHLTPVRTRAVSPVSRAESQPSETVLADGRAVLELESAALAQIASRLDGNFCKAVNLIAAGHGHVVVTGVGKSGHVGRKIAATLSSTGTPSLFLHGAEAAHGDLGVVTAGDILLLLSNSGEVDELKRIVPALREREIPIIALVGRRESALARWADVVLEVAVEREACPHNLVPTTSAVAALAVGDALAIALMRRRGFSSADFAALHPGGPLGRGLIGRVSDAMRKTNLPLVGPDESVGDSLVTMTRGCCGMAIVVDQDQRLLGVFTDGDLRRALQRRRDLRQLPISEIMTSDPVTIPEDAGLIEAQGRMQRLKLQALIVLDAQNRVSGVIQIFNGQ